jgi:integrase
MHAIILLGINAGLGNTDCAEFRHRHVNLDTGIMVYPRRKTGASRRAVLWPETIESIRKAIARRDRRVVPDTMEDRIFMTQHFKPYVHGRATDAVNGQFNVVLRKAGIISNGRGFYGLRHTFRTVADETLDYPAIDLVMGHIPSDAGSPHSVVMAARYRQKISDERLKAVAEYVRKWLWGE